MKIQILLSQPLWFLNISITPIMDSQNDRENACRQHFPVIVAGAVVIVVVIFAEETVRRSKCKAGANLSEESVKSVTKNQRIVMNSPTPRCNGC